MKLIRKNIARNSKPYNLGHATATTSVVGNAREVQIRLFDKESQSHRYILTMSHAEALELVRQINLLFVW